MRAVKAKQLRKMVGYDKHETTYHIQSFYRKVVTDELNEDGTRKEKIEERKTRHLSRGCSRAGYQNLKRSS